MKRFGSRPFLHALIAAAAFDVLFGLAFPPTSLWLCVVFAIVPLTWLAWRTTSPFRSALGVFLGTIPMWLMHHAWLFDVTAAGTPILGLYLAAYPALYVLIVGRMHDRITRVPRWLPAAVTWIGLEYLRGEVIAHGYPWFMISHPLIDAPMVPAISSVIGAYGVGMLAALFSTQLAAFPWSQRRGPRGFIPCATTIGIAVLLTIIAPAPRSSGDIARIGVVQTNLPSSNKIAWMLPQRNADFASFIEQTREVIATEPDLIVWPETMFPGVSLSPEVIAEGQRLTDPPELIRLYVGFHDELQAVRRTSGVPMLVGAIGMDGFRFADGPEGITVEMDAQYNSVFLLDDRDLMTRYDKIHLTPFGEVMPYISAIDWLEEMLLAIGAQGMTFDLDAGTDRTRFAVPTEDGAVRVVTPICFEATTSSVCRTLVYEAGGRRADVLVNVTNDGWFGLSDGGRAHHLLLARWRAAELRTPVVRAANTGISCLIDMDGTVVEALPAREAAGRTFEVALPDAELATPFGRTGNIVGVAAAIGCVILGFAAIRRRSSPFVQEDDAPDSMEAEKETSTP